MPRTRALSIILLIPGLTVAWAPLAFAQQQRAAGIETARPAIATAFRAADGAPRLDGRLDEPIWQRATPITDFTQRDPDEGAPGTERTEVRIVYTDAAVYFGVRAWDTQPDDIAAKLTRRDEPSPSDWIGIAIDSYRDRRTAFLFLVNPAGVQRDVYLYDDTNEDASWNAVWDVAVRRDSAGWTAEFEIPFSQLRFSAAERQQWGLNVYRRINRLNEEQYWRLLPKNESGVVSRFGDLIGIEGVDPPRRIEILPYVVAQQEVRPSVDGNPFATGRARGASFGADVNIGVSSNFTLSATFNPDFGQVEADPAVVNLSAFETFFPEKRPFFLEGLDIFQFDIGVGGGGGSEQLFYTRRIGRAPQGSADPRGGYVDPVPHTTILGAAKLSGKTSGGWTVGMLGALTDEETAAVLSAEGERYADVIEPRTGYMVGRLARDLRGGQTVIGFFGTGVLRDLPDDGRLDFLRTAAVALGTDWRHRFHNDTYSVSGYAAASHIRGAPGAIERAQTSSARYFQRPDADHVSVDPTRTALSGFAGRLSAGKHGGGPWRFSTGVDTRSPGFEVNDLGFQRDADRTVQWSWVQRRWTQPGAVFRRFFVNLNQWYVWNYGGERIALGANMNANFTLRNYWSGFFGVNREVSSLAPQATRGGPAVARPGSWNGWVGFRSDARKDVRGSAGGWINVQDEDAARAGGIWTDVSVRPATNLDLTLSPNVNWRRSAWQYLRTATVADGPHYLFGELEQTTVGMQFRGNFTFTPALSVQLYAEPFVSAGDYVAFKRVADPRADTFADRFDEFRSDRLITDGDGVAVDLDRDGIADVDLGDPDFRVLSFRSNLVLRWEYLRGSTLFLVWQHGRRGFSTDGRFDVTGSFNDLFTADGENTLLVKLNYWLSL